MKVMIPSTMITLAPYMDCCTVGRHHTQCMAEHTHHRQVRINIHCIQAHEGGKCMKHTMCYTHPGTRESTHHSICTYTLNQNLTHWWTKDVTASPSLYTAYTYVQGTTSINSLGLSHPYEQKPTTNQLCIYSVHCIHPIYVYKEPICKGHRNWVKEGLVDSCLIKQTPACYILLYCTYYYTVPINVITTHCVLCSGVCVEVVNRHFHHFTLL